MLLLHGRHVLEPAVNNLDRLAHDHVLECVLDLAFTAVVIPANSE